MPVAVGGGKGVHVGTGVEVHVAVGIKVLVAVGDGISVLVGVGVTVLGMGVWVSNVAVGIFVLVAQVVEVGMGVRVPGCKMLMGVFVDVGDSTGGTVGVIISALSSGANAKAMSPKP